jgi:bleomycin hydrolase
MSYLKTSCLLLFLIIAISIKGQTTKSLPNTSYEFTIQQDVTTTSVEHQYKTGTCWSYAGLSFFESELSRLNQQPVNLSEMFIVWHTYSDKAERYVRMHGDLRFSQGGAFHDVRYVAEHYGLVPEEVFGDPDHPNHGELFAVLKGMVEGVIKNKNGTLTAHWHQAIQRTLDTYLGEVPDTFQYEGEQYTPKSYADHLGLQPENYVEITSFTHHPFYEKFVLEVPDNWRWEQVYNVPLDEFEQILDYALKQGYSVAWASDISSRGFNFNKGLALLPQTPMESMTEKERDSAFIHPVPQRTVTQRGRQQGFDQYEVTDDHGMHITGIATDQNETKYYIVKNSWGRDNSADGYLYASRAFVLYNTTNIMVHKEAIPPSIAEKLNLKKVSN